MKHLGIDIGTTTICGAVLSTDGKFIEALTEPNSSSLSSTLAYERIQDAEAIVKTVRTLTEKLLEKHPDIASIGLTGQMHGILYTNADGICVSPLYTWQDARGEHCAPDGECYADRAARISGYRMASGYGIVTHYFNSLHSIVPDRAVTFCTIADYAVMRLCGRSDPLLHSSNAASLGCFDLQKLEFDKEAIEKLAIPAAFLPAVTSDSAIAGSFHGIPVSVAIGDNQASFIGSGADDDSILVNVGTGSQLSLVSDFVSASGSVELRPFLGDRYLLVGSSLSGGRAYALLEAFFRSVVKLTGVNIESMYPYMTSALERYEGEPLQVSTLFDGSRDEPSARGSITHIGIDNFTPEATMLGFLNGIADELYGMYRKMNTPEKVKLIGSGNGLRRNRKLVEAFERCFSKPLSLSDYTEEAACGAALFGREAAAK